MLCYFLPRREASGLSKETKKRSSEKNQYYDPMYDYQLEKKRQKITFSGDATAVLEYIAGRDI